MDDLTYIREELKKFEMNIDGEQGIVCLDNALSWIRDILDNSNDARKRRIANNNMLTHRDKVVEKAKALISSGTPDSELLRHIMNMMDSFVNYDFGDEPEFSGLKTELSSRLADEFIRKVRGKYPKDFDEDDKLWLQDIMSKLIG